MVQTCQVNWTITIPKNTLAIQLNKAAGADVDDAPTANAAINFNADADPAVVATIMTQAEQDYHSDEVLHFWLGFSTACGPFNQFAICKDNTKLWDTSIYAREQAVICANSLSDLCTNNSVSVSPLESIIAGKRHCGVFIDVKMKDINAKATAAGPPLAPKTEYYYLIPEDITFSGVLDLNQLNPIFNSFPVLTRNYASLYLQLWMQDFLQDLKVVWLNKTDMVKNNRLAYHMIPPEKPDIVYLMLEPAEDIIAYERYTVRIVNMQGDAATAKEPQKTISQIQNAKFNKLEIQNVCFNVENEEAIVELIRNQRIINFPTQILRTQSTNCPFGGFKTGNSLQSIMSFSNIKSIFMTFAMPQYPTWFFPVLFQGFDLIIDQRHVIPAPYEALTQITNGVMFDCFVDQDVVSAPSDQYHSLTFENTNIRDGDNQNYGIPNWGGNIFYTTTLYKGTKATKTMYPNKFMLAWKMATDDSFQRGYNSTQIGTRTNIQVNLTPLMHYLCDGIVRVLFDDNPDPQVLSMEVIGEIGGSVVRSG
ncbi:MAG: hypothetical protein EZS28_021052 [Streblomastix strix]|uniref:Uncharacterized protein n=1 Tax=Streblomastix strix TaxID=222440 RepID=A0A5J4VLN5_9EUKA|nr:MAG: hypothetical protein EZS28_021052 [Streblomastix strix]